MLVTVVPLIFTSVRWSGLRAASCVNPYSTTSMRACAVELRLSHVTAKEISEVGVERPANQWSIASFVGW